MLIIGKLKDFFAAHRTGVTITSLCVAIVALLWAVGDCALSCAEEKGVNKEARKNLEVKINHIDNRLVKLDNLELKLEYACEDIKLIKENLEKIRTENTGYKTNVDSDLKNIKKLLFEKPITALGGPGTPPVKRYRGRIGIIKAQKGTNTASGYKYDPERLYAAKNLNGKLSKAKFSEEYTIFNTEFANIYETGALAGSLINVTIIDTFYGPKDVLLSISPAAARALGFPKEKGYLKVEVCKTSEFEKEYIEPE
jgi:hypothetical protein